MARVLHVDLLVLVAQRHQRLGIARDVSVHHALDLIEGKPGHDLDRMRQPARGRRLADRVDALGDVLGEVADALQIGAPCGSRRPPRASPAPPAGAGDQGDGVLVEGALALVHHQVLGDDALCQRGVGSKQCACGVLHHRACQLAHLADQPVDVLEIVIERPDGVFGHDCVPQACAAAWCPDSEIRFIRYQPWVEFQSRKDTGSSMIPVWFRF